MTVDSIVKFLARLRRKRELWSIALFKLDDVNQVFNLSSLKPFFFIGENGIRLNKTYKATVADPFLFVRQERLYVLYEVQTDFGIGQIHALSMDKNGDSTDHGLILKEEHHLSYPQVFEHEGNIFMIPESAASGKVWLYRSDAFPLRWEKIRPLIEEPLVDASIVFTDEFIYLLGTARNDELKLYYSKTLDEKFLDSGIVISSDRSVSRNAGRPMVLDGSLYRFSQNCKNFYGENISLSRILTLGPHDYSEQLVISDLFTVKPKWMEMGHHHISICPFDGDFIVAVDGKRPDKFINTLTLAFLKIIGGK